jgi:hypothetical protein
MWVMLRIKDLFIRAIRVIRGSESPQPREGAFHRLELWAKVPMVARRIGGQWVASVNFQSATDAAAPTLFFP